MNLFERIYIRLFSTFSTLIGKMLFKIYGIEYGKDLILRGLPIISKHKGSRIILGDRVTLCSSSLATALGVNHPIVLRTLTEKARIEIGNDVGISGGSICSGKLIKIGSVSILGANVTIIDTDFHPIEAKSRRYGQLPESGYRPVVIEENVFIGTNVVVLKGVNIGKNTVIGAGSIVTQNIPPNSIAAGNPCRVIKLLPSTQEGEK